MDQRPNVTSKDVMNHLYQRTASCIHLVGIDIRHSVDCNARKALQESETHCICVIFQNMNHHQAGKWLVTNPGIVVKVNNYYS